MTDRMALSGLRVLEYGNLVAGPYCARLLGDAGADVVKVEPPAGDQSRRRGPFPDGVVDPEWSGLYLYVNANKRGITLDLEEQRDMGTFRDLLRHIDVLVLNHPPARLERLGLRRYHLRKLNPGLIVTTITPFGLKGPYRDFVGDELIAVSAGGLAYATPGIPDTVHDPDEEPPLRANAFVGEFIAGVQGAIASVAAVMTRDHTGEGSEVDVSQQEAVAMVIPYELAHASYLEPKGREPIIFGAMPNAYLPCKDGYVVVVAVMEHHWRALTELVGDPELAEIEVFADAAERARNWDALEPLLLEWTMSHTGAEIAQLAQSKGIPCFPAYTVGQMVDSEHVAARRFLWTLEEPKGRKFKLPGYPVHMDSTPWCLRRRAPRLGEHTAEVLREWTGYSLQGARRPPRHRGHSGGDVTELPLQGIRVADFGQMIAMPFTAQVLAWLGAEVILVENRKRLGLRELPPYAGGVLGVNRSGGFNMINNNKFSCTFDLGKKDGLELAERLIGISDVVVENFSTGTMEKLGLGYEAVRRLKPDIIYLSLGAFGRTGPMKDFKGLHSVINLFSGLAAVTGYPGGHPRVLGGYFPDAFSGCYCILAVLEALYHRSKTGEGQYVDVAMTEALSTLIPEAVMDYTLTGREAEQVGNRDNDKAPHDVFRCRGVQKWVAISVATDAQWGALWKVMGHLEWAEDPRFADSASRWAHQDALRPLIESWTHERTPYEVTTTLQNVGVAATPVLDSGEVLGDPHMLDRGFVDWVDHPEAGRRPITNLSWSINGERPKDIRHAPLLGEHNHYVLRELLRLPEEEVQRLMDSGAVG